MNIHTDCPMYHQDAGVVWEDTGYTAEDRNNGPEAYISYLHVFTRYRILFVLSCHLVPGPSPSADVYRLAAGSYLSSCPPRLPSKLWGLVSLLMPDEGAGSSPLPPTAPIGCSRVLVRSP